MTPLSVKGDNAEVSPKRDEPSLADVLRALEDFRAEFRALKAPKPKLILSLRQAAARLGVDRATTLHDLIRLGVIRTVDVNGKTKIPVAEVERLAREGFRTDGVAPKSKPKARKPAASEPWSKTDALKF